LCSSAHSLYTCHYPTFSLHITPPPPRSPPFPYTTLFRSSGPGQDQQPAAIAQGLARFPEPAQQSLTTVGRILGIRIRHAGRERLDRKSTRLNSSHQIISYAVFCLKKKK